jgi:biotin carboxyl carrier protein
MESKLYTSISGTVSAINVQVGQQIDSETVLIVVEKQN